MSLENMLSGIKASVVVYTGAAGLIGRDACKALAQSGARLALLDPDKANLDKLVQEIRSSYPDSSLLAFSDVDTLNEQSVDGCLDKISAQLGSIDCLVSSAYPRTADWHLKYEAIPFASWQKNVDTHLNGYFLVSQRCALRMMKQKKGNIVFFSSIYGVVGPQFAVYEGLGDMTMPAAYAAIKGGVSNFTRYLASYLGPYGIRVNAICPGGVESSQNPSFIKAYCDRVPLGRMANTDDVVGPLLFLISNMSQYVSGINLAVDGGWSAV